MRLPLVIRADHLFALAPEERESILSQLARPWTEDEKDWFRHYLREQKGGGG